MLGGIEVSKMTVFLVAATLFISGPSYNYAQTAPANQGSESERSSDPANSAETPSNEMKLKTLGALLRAHEDAAAALRSEIFGDGTESADMMMAACKIEWDACKQTNECCSGLQCRNVGAYGRACVTP